MRRRDIRLVMLMTAVLAVMVLCKLYPASMVPTPTEFVAENQTRF